MNSMLKSSFCEQGHSAPELHLTAQDLYTDPQLRPQGKSAKVSQRSPGLWPWSICIQEVVCSRPELLPSNCGIHSGVHTSCSLCALRATGLQALMLLSPGWLLRSALECELQLQSDQCLRSQVVTRKAWDAS